MLEFLLKYKVFYLYDHVIVMYIHHIVCGIFAMCTRHVTTYRQPVIYMNWATNHLNTNINKIFTVQSFKNDVDVDFNNFIRTVHWFARNDSLTVAII